jgi:hypothetical protein
MIRLLISLTIFTFSFVTIFAQDTLIVHAVKLVSNGNSYLVDGTPVAADIFKKLEDEQRNFKTKSLNKLCWVKKISKDNKMIEQGLFCNGTTPVGNVIKYNAKGLVTYKKLYSGVKITACGQSEVGRKAIEEIYDFAVGLKIYGSYQDGLKHGQFLYYDKTVIVGVEAYEKGQLLKRTGKIYTVKEDGSFALSNLGGVDTITKR